MTIGEIWAVMWARTRENKKQNDNLEELYQDLLAAKGIDQ